MLASLVSYFTLRYEGVAFTDGRLKRPVKIYRDIFGTRYLKLNRWGLTAVQADRMGNYRKWRKARDVGVKLSNVPSGLNSSLNRSHQGKTRR